MAIQKLSFTGENGVAASLANTGYDQLVVTDASGSMQFDSSWMPRGRISCRSTGSTSAGYVMGRKDITATDTLAFDQPVRPLALPTATTGEEALFYFGNLESRRVSVNVLANGALRIRDGANVNAWTSAAGVLAVGVGVIVSVYIVRHASAGSVRVIVYNESDLSVRADSTLLTGRNTGADSINRTRSSMAKGSSSSTIAATYQFGEPRWDTAATGPMPAAIPVWQPYRMWISGAYVPVSLRRWNVATSSYELLTN